MGATGTGAGGATGAARLEADLASLTEAQHRAVASPAEALCVLAGAGSGKTRVLTLRVARRAADGSAEADHTAVCTFTRRAAVELRRRLRAYGVPVAAPATTGGVPGPGVRAGTLHQLALSLLRRQALDTGRRPPAIADRRTAVLAGVVGDAALAGAVDLEIGWAKARCLDPDGYPEAARAAGRRPSLPVERVAGHYAAYQEALGRREALDLDDVLLRAADLLEQDATYAEGVRWRYRHLAVDEFQDVNPAQYRLVRALAGDRHDLLVVGDPHQAIYGWNGADPTLLARLPALVPGMEVVRLDENHRSTPQVVAAASAALGLAEGPRATAADGPRPVVTAYADDTAEAEGVAALLTGRVGGRWRDHAVLARTNEQLGVVAAALARAGVPTRSAPAPNGPDAGAEDDAVELATFHRAKGLEWRSVYVVGLEDGYVPIVHATTGAALDEERRLLYVALTRAERELHCSWARRRRTAGGGPVAREPSPWLGPVEAVATRGTGRIDATDAATRIAALRAGLGR